MEDKQDQDVNQDQAETVDQADRQDQQSTDIEKRIQEMEAKYKSQIKGLDKKVSELAKEKEALEMEKLSESERAEAETKKAKEEADRIKAETELLKRERDLTKVLFESNLDPGIFGERIKGSTLEEMKEDAEKLNAFIDGEVEKRMEKELVKRIGGKTPEGGTTSEKLSYSEQIKRARELSAGRRI